MWFVKWLQEFWVEHGVRFIFGVIALAFAIYFIGQEASELKGAGMTIMIGIAMTSYNKMRGKQNGNGDEKPPVEPE